jgi:nitrate reductase gamma subunit
MEYTREIYWNIGHGAGVLVPMYLLTAAALAILAWGFWQRLKVYRQGKALNRTDELAGRVAGALKAALSQVQVLRVPGAGTAHGLFFWGFFLLFIGTCLIVVQADFTDPLFGVQFLKGHFYLLFSVVLDVAGAVAIVMLGGLCVRRYFFRPPGLPMKRDDAIAHALLLAILVTGFVIEGARMAATELGTPLAAWSPVGLLFAKEQP